MSSQLLSFFYRILSKILGLNRNNSLFEEKYYNYVFLKIKETPQIYSLFRGNLNPEILQYFQLSNSVDKFQFGIYAKYSNIYDDYIDVMGVIDKIGRKYIFLACIDAAWNEHVGFFHLVKEWPTFILFKEPIEEVFKDQEKFK